MIGLGLKFFNVISLPPTITGFANSKTYGSVAGEIPATNPVITGTNFANTSSVMLGGVEHINHVSIGSSTITVNQILPGSAGAFQTISVVTSGGSATFGNGTSTGWTYLPAGYSLYDPDLGLTFISGNATQWNDQGDITAVNVTPAGDVTFASAAINSQNALFYNSSRWAYTDASSWTAGENFHVVYIPSPTLHNIVDTFGSLSDGNGGTYFPYPTDGKIYSDFGCSARQMNGVTSTVSLAFPVILQMNAIAGDWNMWINGHLQANTTTPPIGFTSTPHWGQTSDGSGYTAMTIIYANKNLTTPNRAVVRSFLYGKYSITGI